MSKDRAPIFLGSATARPLETDQLRSALPQLRSALQHFFTRTERLFVSDNGIIHEFVSARFAISVFKYELHMSVFKSQLHSSRIVVKSELHSSSIILCNFQQIKI